MATTTRSQGSSKWETLAVGLLLGTSVTAAAAYVGFKYGTQVMLDRQGRQGTAHHSRRRPGGRTTASRAPSPGLPRGGRRGPAAHDCPSGSTLSPELAENVERAYYGEDVVARAPVMVNNNNNNNNNNGNNNGRQTRALGPPPSQEDGGETSEYYGTDVGGVLPRAVGSMAHHQHLREVVAGVSDAEMGTSAGPRLQPMLSAASGTYAHAHGLDYLPNGAGNGSAPPPLSPRRSGSVVLPAAMALAEAREFGGAAVPTSTPLYIKAGQSGGANGAAQISTTPGSGGSVLMHSYSTPMPSGPSVQPTPVIQSSTNASFMALEGRLIEEAAMHDAYVRVVTPEPAPSEETEAVCASLMECLDLRRKWLFRPALSPEQRRHLPEAKEVSDCIPGGADPWTWFPTPAKPEWDFRMVDGVYHVWDKTQSSEQPWLSPPGSSVDFFSDLHFMLRVAANGNVRSFTYHRLLLLEQKFNLHVMLNSDKEFLAQKSAPHRDFYNVRKVDTHVHHSACMHQKHLLRFMKSKLKKEPDEVVIFRDGKYLTLREVFESLNLTPYDLNVDMLDVHADRKIFQRFDRFNLKYNPFGQSRLREIFIKQDNLLHGRFLAELTNEVFVDLEASKYQHTEYRISVYGRKKVEWDTLAAWVVQNKLSSDNNLWLIQIPRLYNVYKESGIISNFEELLVNIFEPLFEVTRDPSSHPQLHLLLKHVSGFDLVDDESKPERRPSKHMPMPAAWNTKYNPAFAYYIYYMYANLYTLNKMREARGLNTFSLRPHSGEAGDIDHLVATFMAAENIAHGINLRKSPSMQYLYYIAQIGLCMSPLSNNFIFLDYHRNPFPQFFARGLSVSLSTDDPLQIHLTKEPLVEEYSVAAQVWKLSATDLCEIARNSVLHSGYPHQVKMHWVHTEYWRMGPEGNNIQKTNVPALRLRFRNDCHSEEMTLLHMGAAGHAGRKGKDI